MQEIYHLSTNLQQSFPVQQQPTVAHVMVLQIPSKY